MGRPRPLDGRGQVRRRLVRGVARAEHHAVRRKAGQLLGLEVRRDEYHSMVSYVCPDMHDTEFTFNSLQASSSYDATT